jgi:hypothetical protein
VAITRELKAQVADLLLTKGAFRELEIDSGLLKAAEDLIQVLEMLLPGRRVDTGIINVHTD